MFESIAYAMGQAPQSQGQEGPNPLASFMPIILMFVIFYFLLIKPQQKKQREHDKMVSGLKKNDEIITSGGIHGTIVNVKDNTFILRVDDNAKIEISKSAVAVLKRKVGAQQGLADT
jgi:preprotein translocase subunit YajC